ncbi:hypothetical protein [Mesorhizobium sp. CN2-181]|uniref:hypothetical protein n=1 Tax=Mesorhizobium yinganensis TaxID=3157707 RepID=UPI0032B83DF5
MGDPAPLVSKPLATPLVVRAVDEKSWVEGACPTATQHGTGGYAAMFTAEPNISRHAAALFGAPAQTQMTAAPHLAEVTRFDATSPWLVRAPQDVAPADVSRELYGLDISGVENGGLAGQSVIQDLLLPGRLEEFRGQMDARLDQDVATAKKILLHDNDSDLIRTAVDSAVLTHLVKHWSGARDYRDVTGSSYFDAFLERLENSTITVTQSRTIGVYSWKTGTSERSYLDELFNMAGMHSGEVLGLIGGYSVKYGGYRPGWHQLQRAQSGQAPDMSQAPDWLIRRATTTVLDTLAGPTSSSESAMIRDILVKLQPGDKARVIQSVMSHHGDSNWIGLGRFGEPTPQHMLYYLFENLDGDHADEVGKSLVSAGVFEQSTVDALKNGRSWAGKWLPYTTNLGAEAAQWYADRYVQTDNELYLVGGAFASLWTPETATATITTLGSAGLGGALTKAPMWLQKTLMVAGTAPTSFQLTQSVLELGTGRDAYSNKKLNEGEMWSRGLLAVSNAIFLGVGLYGAAKLGAARSSPVMPEVLPPKASQFRALPAAGEGPMVPVRGGSAGPRIIGIDEAGNVRAVARDTVTGEMAYLKFNQTTGDGFAMIPGRGTVQIVGGKPVPQRAALPPGDAMADSVLAAAPETPMLTSGKPRLMLGAGEDSFSDLAPFMHETIGADFKAGTRWVITPEGVVVPELPPMLDPDIPIYVGDGPIPDMNFDQRPVLSGPVPEGLTLHEVFPVRGSTRITTQSVNQMRRAPSGTAQPGQDRGAQLEVFIREGAGPGAYRHGGGIRTPMTGELRFPDVRQSIFGRTLSFEAKNYLRWISPRGGGPAVLREVPLSSEIQQQITNDALEMYYGTRGFRPVWVFGDAPPSAALAGALRRAGIPYMTYGDRIVP